VSFGYTDVRTLLNSGNVVFMVAKQHAGDNTTRIERALKDRLSVTTRVTVLRGREVAEAVRENPLETVADAPGIAPHVLDGGQGPDVDRGGWRAKGRSGRFPRQSAPDDQRHGRFCVRRARRGRQFVRTEPVSARPERETNGVRPATVFDNL
jgi:hypothetical protein